MNSVVTLSTGTKINLFIIVLTLKMKEENETFALSLLKLNYFLKLDYVISKNLGENACSLFSIAFTMAHHHLTGDIR